MSSTEPNPGKCIVAGCSNWSEEPVCGECQEARIQEAEIEAAELGVDRDHRATEYEDWINERAWSYPLSIKVTQPLRAKKKSPDPEGPRLLKDRGDSRQRS